jgi:hypothetical protein
LTISIRQTLARVPGGSLPELSWPEVGRHLRLHCLENRVDKERRERAADRQRLYDGLGVDQMRELIHKVLSHPDVRALRDAWIEYALYVNPMRRICSELATVYQEPAQRSVADDTGTMRYREVQRLTQLDLQMQVVNRLVLLHHALAVGPRMRELPTGEVVPVLDICTPASFTPVRDPLDPTLLIGLIFDNDVQLALGATGPKWTVWTYHETFQINSHGEVIEESVVEHGLGRIPYMLLVLEPVPGKLIDENASSDLVAAAKSIAFLSVVHLKEAASATVRTVIQGDTSRAIRDQADDSRVPLHLPDGVQASTLDGAMNFSAFLADAEKILEITAANRGIPPTILRHGSVASADAREIIRQPLKELRNRQMIAFRDAERALAELFSIVVSPVRPDLAFSPEGFAVDFAEVVTTPGAKESLEIFEHERRLGLTNTVDELMRRNPDLTPDRAVERLRVNNEVELLRNRLMRPMQEISGSASAPAPDTDQDHAVLREVA